ncbi:MAG: DUF4136 domain-containing protein [Desulfobacteraceae bacterium]|nr:DUF4136 domain-containing protein [Desulfobacteraceae bacterium]MBC2754694.1 DUF4136 domain-containing protein [Desulfobacteraceae bacterium]
MKMRTMFFLMLFLILISGCATTSDQSAQMMNFVKTVVYDNSVDYPVSGVYAWYSKRQPIPENPMMDSQQLDKIIQGALKKEFHARGFSLKESGDVHFYVSYHLVIDNRDDDQDINEAYSRPKSPDRWWPGTNTPKVYPQGSLLVDIVCAQDFCPRWRGSVGAQILPGLSEQDRINRIEAAVNSLLLDFPPL